MKFESEADYAIDGVAIDQEAVIRLRPQIEQEVTDSLGPFDHTKLFWEMNEDFTFYFELHFYRESEIEFTAED